MKSIGLIAILAASSLGLGGNALAAPCTSVADCAEWVDLGAVRVMVYRSIPLETRNTEVTRAVIVIHGAGRDADNYFRSMTSGAFLAGALNNTVVISPRFASQNGDCQDKLGEKEANWPCGGAVRWTVGGPAAGDTKVTSFDFMDKLLRDLASKKTFPGLRQIVLTGHSAGGQFVSRYQMSNKVHETLGVPVSYVISNPSSYAYLDPVRPTMTVFMANIQSLPPGYISALPARPPEPFVPFQEGRGCTIFDNWPYGMKDRAGYSADIPIDQLKKQFTSRPAIYLLGGLDILPLFGFDSSCGAMAQGPTRLARGLAFARYANDRLGAKHEVVVVPACGHNGRCMMTDNLSLARLFPDTAVPQ